MHRFKVSLQHDAMQCGIACLQMICRYYGKTLSLAYLESLCPTSADGTSLLGLKRTLDYLGFDTECGQIKGIDLTEIFLPCILHWNNNHFVVLYDIKNYKGNLIYKIVDPAKGKMSLKAVEFNKHFIADSTNKGFVIFAKPSERFYSNKERIKEHNLLLPCLIESLKRFRLSFFIAFLAILLSSVVQIIFPYLTQLLVDKGIGLKNVHTVLWVLVGQLLLSVVSVMVDFIRRRILLKVGFKIGMSLLSDFLMKLFRLPMSFFCSKHTGDLLQRLSDCGRIKGFITGQVLNVLFSLITFAVFSCLLIKYDVSIFFVYYFFSIIYLIWSVLFFKRRKILNYETFEALADNNDKIWQMISNIQEIKLQKCEKRRQKEWTIIQNKIFGLELKSLYLNQIDNTGTFVISNARILIITVLVAISVIDGAMTLGNMMAIQFVVNYLSISLEQLILFADSLQDVKISNDRINDIFCLSDENISGRHLKKFIPFDKKINIENLTFRYDRFSPHPILDKISFVAEQNKVTAIVGSSGSGKTTILKLILSYFAEYEGCIQIGHNDIKDFDVNWWRSQCGVVMQDGVLFSDTIANNIATCDNCPDMIKLKKAAKLACIEEFIKKLPSGFNTIIGHNGMGVSAGQKQRILIARAIYKNPQFLFLDEATNSLDAKVENEILCNLRGFYRGRTVMVVAHRLSTVIEADKIIVLNDGHIVETGTHKDLINNYGMYYQLVKEQLGG